MNSIGDDMYRIAAYHSLVLATAIWLAGCANGADRPAPDTSADTAEAIGQPRPAPPAAPVEAGGGKRPGAPPSSKPAPPEAPSYSGGNAINPGNGIGGVKIGESFQSVVKKLGKPDSSDAGMGHVWGWWISARNGVRNELGIYASFDNEATDHYVRQIRVTSPYFVTSDGIATGSSLGDILAAYPSARPIVRYGTKPEIHLYDDVKKGIAFEVTHNAADSASGKCVAIVVHGSGKDIGDQYLPARNYKRIGSETGR